MFSHLRYAPNADCIHDSHARSLCALKNETWQLYKTFTKIFTEFLIDKHKFVEIIRRFAIAMNWRATSVTRLTAYPVKTFSHRVETRTTENGSQMRRECGPSQHRLVRSRKY